MKKTIKAMAEQYNQGRAIDMGNGITYAPDFTMNARQRKAFVDGFNGLRCGARLNTQREIYHRAGGKLHRQLEVGDLVVIDGRLVSKREARNA